MISPDDVPELEAPAVYDKLAAGEVAILDVRELSEWEPGHIEGSVHIPLGQLQARWNEIDPHKAWVCVCLGGVRSSYAAAFLRQAGIDASSLAGGMLAWQACKFPVTDPGIVINH